jgi:hypothetical protein
MLQNLLKSKALRSLKNMDSAQKTLYNKEGFGVQWNFEQIL